VRKEMITEDPKKDHSKHLFDISSIIIPFSTFIKKELPSDIYSENDRTPFNKRDPEFKKIILHEFL